jgi:hypothetical protein
MKQYESFFRAAPEAFLQITYRIVSWDNAKAFDYEGSSKLLLNRESSKQQRFSKLKMNVLAFLFLKQTTGRLLVYSCAYSPWLNLTCTA